MKRALTLNVIDPGIGGVLIKGEKGTAKSTIVRSMARILPERNVVKGCMFGCDPDDENNLCPFCKDAMAAGSAIEASRSPTLVVELPLSATEDRVAGTLDVEHVLKTGQKKFEPGVLAQANGNILYVDEVNLLDDHIVDLLLDSAAMGVNHVEREGISFSHPSRFILIGTMNPEEGELRPQLLDRFGLSVQVTGERDVATRREVVKRRLAFDSGPEAFIESHMSEIMGFKGRLDDAIRLLPSVDYDESMLDAVINLTTKFEIDGHRADIAMMKSAKANAAFHGRRQVEIEDLIETADLVLSHRMRRRPFEESEFDHEELERCLRGI